MNIIRENIDLELDHIVSVFNKASSVNDIVLTEFKVENKDNKMLNIKLYLNKTVGAIYKLSIIVSSDKDSILANQILDENITMYNLNRIFLIIAGDNEILLNMKVLNHLGELSHDDFVRLKNSILNKENNINSIIELIYVLRAFELDEPFDLFNFCTTFLINIQNLLYNKPNEKMCISLFDEVESKLNYYGYFSDKSIITEKELSSLLNDDILDIFSKKDIEDIEDMEEVLYIFENILLETTIILNLYLKKNIIYNENLKDKLKIFVEKISTGYHFCLKCIG